jgi:hypothetical protein
MNSKGTRAWNRASAAPFWMALALSLIGSHRALAQTRIATPLATAAALVWRVPDAAACSTREQMRARVAALTTRALLDPAAAPNAPQIVVDVQHAGDRWSARVSPFDAAGRPLGARDLESKSFDCGGLDVALALVIATLLDALPEPPDARGGTPAADSSKQRGALGLRAGVGPGFGLAPSTMFGLTLGLEWPLIGTALALAFDASAYLPYDEVDARERGAALWTWHAGLALCPSLWRGPVPLRLCAGGQVGAIHASSIGLSPTTSKQRLLVMAGLEPRLSLALTRRLELQLSAFAGWAPIRPKFTLNTGGSDLDTLHGTPFVLLIRIGIIGFVQ